MAVEYRSVLPTEYYEEFLRENIRPDGRQLDETRSTVLSLGTITTANGSAVVKRGCTTVVCCIKAEITEPSSMNPTQGFIIPNVDIPGLCSPHFKAGPPSTEAQVTTVMLHDLIKSVGYLEEINLAIIPGKYVWVLYIDIVCLDFDGNLFDACVTAMTSALKTVKLPKVESQEDSERPKVDLSELASLNVISAPISTTFCQIKGKFITDPTLEEETMADSKVIVVGGQDNDLYMLRKLGAPLESANFASLLTKANVQTCKMLKAIDETITCVPDR